MEPQILVERRSTLLAVCIAVVLCSCSSASTGGAPAGADVGAGYFHTRAASKFALGSVVEEKAEFGYQKTVGTEGVFAVHIATRGAVGSPNAGAPCASRGPLAPAETHAAAVRAYFMSGGLASNQITMVSTGSSASGGGSATGGPQTTTLTAYTSSLQRTVDGFPVVDSIAYASMNADSVVCSEQVDWPTIPPDVLADARELRTIIADAAKRSAFEARLPTTSKDGKVVIRHSTSAQGKPTAAFAAYEVSGNGTSRDFDANANELPAP
ncbi:MAG: hypothetical protein JWM74_2392 [Myxococcaceae bacterium]|nr:hypothetical protein [Myxococcaceae bacterium]